ncbi:3-oxoacyl-ACP reductase [Candidatus Nitromaritima sp. SCGC AAA799-C22]|nr:3-oxoacyl-ACP reductase [Candidatus Nitromaritima sp. SCGC AAA799-C22]
MEIDLKNRKVVVTGAGDGIGRSLALAFGEAGARVAGCARSGDRLHSVEKEIDGKGHHFSTADFSKSEDIRSFHDKTIEALGGVDVLINNVGSVQKLAGFFDLTDEDWQEAFDVNLMSAVRACRTFTPSLKQSAAPRIINIASVAAARPGDVFPHYSAAKAGLCNLTVSLARALADDRVLVNSISPGPVWSRSWEEEARQTAERTGGDRGKIADEIRSSTGETLLLKRMGVPEDVTGLALFLASDLSRWITASNFTVDGGFTQDPY